MAIFTFCTICLCFWASDHCKLSSVYSQSAKQGLDKKNGPWQVLFRNPHLFSFALWMGEEKGYTCAHTHTLTHLRIKDICYFCNTTVLYSTHIDCTICSSLYSEIQQGLNFAPCSGMALLAWKNEHGEEKHTVHIYSSLTLNSICTLCCFLGFHTYGKRARQ